MSKSSPTRISEAVVAKEVHRHLLDSLSVDSGKKGSGIETSSSVAHQVRSCLRKLEDFSDLEAKMRILMAVISGEK
ncbi:putative pre-mRNA-processing factor [Sesbania bispinosa]|nr:putative pre-mRNA-processing factor [Sesbania bispinosa]